MANSQKMMFFAVKLIAPKIGDPKMNTGGIPATFEPTKHACEYDESRAGGNARFLVIGGKRGSAYHGIAGHFVVGVLDFGEKADKACKSLAEAEQWVKKHHKPWLADAYEWFVIPAQMDSSGASAPFASKPKSKSGKPAKK